MDSELEEQKINIRDFNINYIKIGNGEHPVLLMPGILGSIQIDFGHQLEELNRKKFTIVAWDPPGYGKSRPPDRTFTEDFLEQDASLAHDFMQALGHKTFSAIGLCNGGQTCCALAAMYPDSIRKIILVSTNSHLLPGEICIYERLRNFNLWPKTVWKIMEKNYGVDYFEKVWTSWTNLLLDSCTKRNGDICTSFLEKIQCSTLIVTGAKDGLIDQSHAPFLNTKIRNSRVHTFEKGHHMVHRQFSDEFNDLVTNFLLSEV